MAVLDIGFAEKSRSSGKKVGCADELVDQRVAGGWLYTRIVYDQWDVDPALIDGCSRFETIWRIIVPLSLPALATVFIYAFMIAWNEYLFAYVFLKSYKNLYTLPIGLKGLFVSKNAIWDRIMAASMLTAVPVVVLFMLIQKNLVGGLTAGGVKE